MGYSIELSLGRCRCDNLSSLKELIVEKGHNLDCDNIYYFHEVERIKKKLIHYNIICANFNEDNIENLALFINFLKKLRGVHIEAIYEDDITYRLIHASSLYLKKLDKEFVKIFKSQKENDKENHKKDKTGKMNKTNRKRSYSDTDYIILSQLLNLGPLISSS